MVLAAGAAQVQPALDGDGHAARDSWLNQPSELGFDPQGMVVRMYEGDRQGRVLHVGTR